MNEIIDIVIIFKEIDDFIIECVNHCLKLNYQFYNILLLPDNKLEFPIHDDKIKIIPTGSVSIPVKRNIGLQNSRSCASLIAFIDSDAFPTANWLTNAVKHFANQEIFAVGGPNLTPVHDQLLRKITGFVMSQKIAFGAGAIRQKIAKSRFTQELPTCNLIVRKKFLEHNPFDENLCTGEDAKLCHDIIKHGYKILYANNVIVYHHRRKLLKPFLLQLFNYGYDKGVLFIKKTLKSFYYVIPSLFLVSLICAIILSFFSFNILILTLSFFLLYIAICSISSFTATLNFLLSPFVAIIIFLGHVSYGAGFIKAIIDKIIFKGKIIKKRKVKGNIPG